MRASKQALAAALRDDPDLTELVPPGSIHAVERATIPTLPRIEIIGVQSAAADYLVRHEMAIEVGLSGFPNDI